MNRIILPVLLIELMLAPLVMAAGITPAQTSVICQTRESCAIGSISDGGNSAAGSTLTVVTAQLGLKDKPDDAPDDGCHGVNGFDGGVEYWLLEGTAAPKRLLKLCSDGYGAAGVGDDVVTVGANRLVHGRSGGSRSRWEWTVTSTLSPWRAVAERDCSYDGLSVSDGSITDFDYLTMSVRLIVKDSTSQEFGCPQWPPGASEHFTPVPGPKLLGAYSILAPNLGKNGGTPKLPAGTAIGDCAPAMTTAGANGFIVFGHPAPAEQAAEIRVVADSNRSVLVQVFDPTADAPAPPASDSWIHLPHIEIWIGTANPRPPLSDLQQIAVDLNGKLYAGAGRQDAMPSVERWQARDDAGHPVVLLHLTWTKALGGTGIVYSQAEAGRQARLVATMGVVKNHPLFLPALTSGGCRISDGRLSMDPNTEPQ